MAILVDSNNKRPANSYGPGIFVDEVTIVSAEIITQDNLPRYLKRTPDIGVMIRYSIGKDFQPTMDIFGDFKQTDKGLTWSGAYKVRDLFEKLGHPMREFDTDQGITPEMVEFLIGKKFKRLSYVKGVRTDDPSKYNFCDWTEIAGPNETAESLVARFQKSLAKGYPSNYHPEVIRTGSTVQAGAALAAAGVQMSQDEEEVF